MSKFHEPKVPQTFKDVAPEGGRTLPGLKRLGVGVVAGALLPLAACTGDTDGITQTVAPSETLAASAEPTYPADSYQDADVLKNIDVLSKDDVLRMYDIAKKYHDAGYIGIVYTVLRQIPEGERDEAREAELNADAEDIDYQFSPTDSLPSSVSTDDIAFLEGLVKKYIDAGDAGTASSIVITALGYDNYEKYDELIDGVNVKYVDGFTKAVQAGDLELAGAYYNKMGILGDDIYDIDGDGAEQELWDESGHMLDVAWAERAIDLANAGKLEEAEDAADNSGISSPRIDLNGDGVADYPSEEADHTIDVAWAERAIDLANAGKLEEAEDAADNSGISSPRIDLNGDGVADYPSEEAEKYIDGKR